MPCASSGAVCQEKAQLEDELRQKEKRMLHLRQVFAAKTAEFCETLSAILGGKVAFYDNDRCGSHRSMISAPVAVAVRERSGCSSLHREREGRRNCHS